MIWYFPSPCGDIRVLPSPDTEGHARIEILNPTEVERMALRRFVKAARAAKLLTEDEGLPPTGTTKVHLDVAASVRTVGEMLLGTPKQGILLPGVLQALRWKDGTIAASLAGGFVDDDGTVWQTLDAASAQKPRKSEAPAEEPAAKATLPRPTLCCPNPQPGQLDPASQVLQQFCTDAEWDEWCRDGQITVTGNLTGDVYRVRHRHHPDAIRDGKAAWCVAQRNVVHCHLATLPPPEEVLSIKLTLQFGEDWVRNPSGWFGFTGARFEHPLGLGYSDGIPSAGILASVPALAAPGLALRALQRLERA